MTIGSQISKLILRSSRNKQPDDCDVLLDGIFTLLGKLAAADGTVDPRERKYVEFFVDSRLNLTYEKRDVALKLFDEAARDPRSVQEVASLITEKFPASPQIRELLMDALLTVSLADEVLDVSEDESLQEIAQVLEVERAAFERLKAVHISNQRLNREDRFYRVLGCLPSCADEELLQAFSFLTAMYQPEAVKKSGLPQAFFLMTQKRLEDIEEAFNVIAAKRGILPDEPEVTLS